MKTEEGVLLQRPDPRRKAFDSEWKIYEDVTITLIINKDGDFKSLSQRSVACSNSDSDKLGELELPHLNVRGPNLG